MWGMKDFIIEFSKKSITAIENLPHDEIAKALNILQGVYERDGRVYIFGNGGSWAIAGHWVTDFNKTVFSHHLSEHNKRFKVSRIPATEEELTAWANDIGYDMVFAGPLDNVLEDSDVVIAISSSGNSVNIIKAVEVAKKHKVPVIGLSGFDKDNKLNQLADIKIHVPTPRGEYEIVESTHDTIMHLMVRYLRNYFDYVIEKQKENG